MNRQESLLTVAEKHKDIFGDKYYVNTNFIKYLIQHFLYCDAVTEQNNNYWVILQDYIRYIDRQEPKYVKKKQLIAIDTAVFNFLMENVEHIEKRTNNELQKMTTLFCEFSKLEKGLPTKTFAVEENRRLGVINKEKKMCNGIIRRNCNGM
jgi:hypothetical protein